MERRLTGRKRGFEDFQTFTNRTTKLPWMYLTQPAVTSVSICFSIILSSTELNTLWDSYKNSFNLSDRVKWKGDKVTLHDDHGIKANFVLEMMVDALKVLYGLEGKESLGFLCSLG